MCIQYFLVRLLLCVHIISIPFVRNVLQRIQDGEILPDSAVKPTNLKSVGLCDSLYHDISINAISNHVCVLISHLNTDMWTRVFHERLKKQPVNEDPSPLITISSPKLQF